MSAFDIKVKIHNFIIQIRIKPLMVTLLALSIFVGAVTHYVITMSKNNNLDKKGIQTEAIVTYYSTPSSKGSTSYYLQYKFKADDNIWYNSNKSFIREGFWNFVSKDEWLDSTGKGKISIIYLKNNPKVNKPLENKSNSNEYFIFTISLGIIILFSGLFSFSFIIVIYNDFHSLKRAIDNNQVFFHTIRKNNRKTRIKNKYFLWNIKKLKTYCS